MSIDIFLNPETHKFFLVTDNFTSDIPIGFMRMSEVEPLRQLLERLIQSEKENQENKRDTN